MGDGGRLPGPGTVRARKVKRLPQKRLNTGEEGQLDTDISLKVSFHARGRAGT